ncbi:MAG: hypothetical protein LBD23_17005 [Oscillospiraceae bacterium]|jgi:general stress protein CsbA|nr:hypothetical protein [Oscillospiraceae bacterium]
MNNKNVKNKEIIIFLCLILLSLPICFVNIDTQTFFSYTIGVFLKVSLLGTLWGMSYEIIIRNIHGKYILLVLAINLIILSIFNTIISSFLFILMQLPSFFIGILLLKTAKRLKNETKNRIYDTTLLVGIFLFSLILILTISFILSLTGFDINNNIDALP